VFEIFWSFIMLKTFVASTLLTSVASIAHAQVVTPPTVTLTTNQTAVRASINTPAVPVNADVVVLQSALNAAALTQNQALSQLTPSSYSLLPDVSLNAAEVQETNIERYLRDLRGNAETPEGDTLTIDEAGRVGAFVVSGARFGKYKADADRPAAKNDEFHVMGGLDFRLSPKKLLGAFGGYSRTDADLSGPDVVAPSRLNSWFAGGYGTVGVGPFYIDAFGSYTDLKWELSRGYNFGGISGVSTARANGHVWTAGGSTGLSFSVGNFEIEPFAALRYASIKINGFTETGSPAALNIGKIDAESLRLNLGGRVGTKFNAGSVVVRPQLRGGWYKEFELDDPRFIAASFTNAGISTQFQFQTTPLSSEYYNAGAALNIAGSGPLSMVVDYDVQFDKEREFHALTLGARLKF
jgi:outer membrane autotransporter protein